MSQPSSFNAVRTKSSFVSPANIALIKYWGKRDEVLNLPFNSSISMTLNELRTHTTLELLKVLPETEIAKDDVLLNGQRVYDPQKLIAVKKYMGVAHWHLRVHSQNNFPTASGLASSASGLSAFVGALWGLSNKPWSDESLRYLSTAARVGSGSASRSFFVPFAKWDKGILVDGSDSYAHKLPYHPDLEKIRLTVVLVSSKPKEVPSTLGMQKTVRDNPQYPLWVDYAEACGERMRELLLAGDVAAIGTLAEENALRMHETTLPSYGYFLPQTWEVIKAVQEWRKQTGGIAYCTMDAGPNVKIISDAPTAVILHKWCLQNGWEIISTGLGNPARPVSQHLF